MLLTATHKKTTKHFLNHEPQKIVNRKIKLWAKEANYNEHSLECSTMQQRAGYWLKQVNNCCKHLKCDVVEDTENQLDRRWQMKRCWYIPIKLGACWTWSGAGKIDYSRLLPTQMSFLTTAFLVGHFISVIGFI